MLTVKARLGDEGAMREQDASTKAAIATGIAEALQSGPKPLEVEISINAIYAVASTSRRRLQDRPEAQAWGDDQAQAQVQARGQAALRKAMDVQKDMCGVRHDTAEIETEKCRQVTTLVDTLRALMLSAPALARAKVPAPAPARDSFSSRRALTTTNATDCPSP